MATQDKTLGVSEVALRVGLGTDTLRYYERSGALPYPARDERGRRAYTEEDVQLIEMLVHLKNTGMPLAAIAEFIAVAALDLDSGRERLHILMRHQATVLDQRSRLDQSLQAISRKIVAYSVGVDSDRSTLGRPDATIAFAMRGRGPFLFLVGAPAGRAGFADLACPGAPAGGCSTVLRPHRCRAPDRPRPDSAYPYAATTTAPGRAREEPLLPWEDGRPHHVL